MKRANLRPAVAVRPEAVTTPTTITAAPATDRATDVVSVAT